MKPTIYPPRGAEKIGVEIQEKGYVWARLHYGLSDKELDSLRMLVDPIFAVDKLRSDEYGDEELPIYQKLQGIGLAVLES